MSDSKLKGRIRRVAIGMAGGVLSNLAEDVIADVVKENVPFVSEFIDANGEVTAVPDADDNDAVGEVVAMVEDEPTDLVGGLGIQAIRTSDDLSFDDAFAHARLSLGAGGVFAWRGNAYSTYYEEEWQEMTHDERSEFLSDAMDGDLIDGDVHVDDIPEVPVDDGYDYVLGVDAGTSDLVADDYLDLDPAGL